MNIKARHSITIILILLVASNMALASDQSFVLCSKITSSVRPEVHGGWYPSQGSYSDRRKVPEMVVSMSSDQVINAIKDTCPESFDGKETVIRLSNDHLIYSQEKFFREQSYDVIEPHNETVHGNCYQTLYVWFAQNGDIHNFYYGYELCAV